MPEPPNSSSESVPMIEELPEPGQTTGPAFASAVFPGLGQLALGEGSKALVYFVLLAIWILLFFPPVQSPRYWKVWGNQELAGIALAFASTFQALRSRAGGRRPGHLVLLVALLPVSATTMVASHHFLTQAAGFRDYRINGTAMQPALRDKDTIMASLHEFRMRAPARGEIVLLKSPNTPGSIIIKRVIAEGGDTITGKNGQVLLNRQCLDEPYVVHTARPALQLMNFGPVTVPSHKFFVMGDNRDFSLDSRQSQFGLIEESAILGKAIYIVTPAHNGTGHELR